MPPPPNGKLAIPECLVNLPDPNIPPTNAWPGADNGLYNWVAGSPKDSPNKFSVLGFINWYPNCLAKKPIPFGDIKNLPILAASIADLSTDVSIPPLGKSNVENIFPTVDFPNPHRCGSELPFLCIPLNIKGCFT